MTPGGAAGFARGAERPPEVCGHAFQARPASLVLRVCSGNAGSSKGSYCPCREALTCMSIISPALRRPGRQHRGPGRQHRGRKELAHGRSKLRHQSGHSYEWGGKDGNSPLGIEVFQLRTSHP